MGKFKKRQLTLIDLIQGIKHPGSDFIGIVQYVGNYISKHFEEADSQNDNEEGVSQYDKVNDKLKKECHSLLDSVNRSDYSKDILEIINEFTNKYKHFEFRLHEILYKLPSGKDVQVIDEVTVWFNIIYRVGIQAIIQNYHHRHIPT